GWGTRVNEEKYFQGEERSHLRFRSGPRCCDSTCLEWARWLPGPRSRPHSNLLPPDPSQTPWTQARLSIPQKARTSDFQILGQRPPSNPTYGQWQDRESHRY